MTVYVINMDHLLHPKYSTKLIGHAYAIKAFEMAWNTKLMHHAWLISGPEGIGKATFAYHASNFILGSKEKARRLNEIKETKTSSLIKSSAHPDLFVAEQNTNNHEYLSKKIISIGNIREINVFLSKTPTISDWRVAIIDSINNLSLNGVNSILKILEEPPQKTVIFLISHNKYEISKTLISRCRKLYFSMLSQTDTLEIIKAKHSDYDEKELDDLSKISNGTPGFAINIIINEGLRLYKIILEIFLSSPNLNWEDIHNLCSKLSAEKLNLVANLLRTFVYRIIIYKLFKNDKREKIKLILNERKVFIHVLNFLNHKNILELWQDMAENTGKTNKFNLDNKQLLINIFLQADRLLKKNEN